MNVHYINILQFIKGRYKLIAWVFFLCLISIISSAQKASDDFKQVSNAYKDMHQSFEINYYMYSDYTSEKQIQTKQAFYYVWDRMLYYKIDEAEVVNNDRFNLSTDNKNKKIVLNKTNTALEKKYLKQALKINLDSLLARNAVVTLLSESEKERTWRIAYRHPIKGISYLDLTIELPAFRLAKIVLYYAKSFNDIYGTSPANVSKTQKPRLEILYSNYKQLNDEDKEKYFSAKQILTIDKKGSVTLIGNYKKYFLANYYHLFKK